MAQNRAVFDNGVGSCSALGGGGTAHYQDIISMEKLYSYGGTPKTGGGGAPAPLVPMPM